MATLKSRGGISSTNISSFWTVDQPIRLSQPTSGNGGSSQPLLEELRSRFNADLELAATALDRLPVQQEPGLVWSLSGREAINRAFARTILNAKRQIFAGIWDEELDDLGSLLEAAAARGVDTHVAIYGNRVLHGPRTYDMAKCGASARLRLSGRRLAVAVADDTDAVVAEFGDQSSNQATLTTNPVIALLAVEYIKADVTGGY